MLKFAYSIINYYHEAIVQIKNSIINYFENKPEKGLVENNILLLGEHIFFTALGALLFGREKWLYDITMMWEHNLNSSIIIYYFLYTVRYIVQTQMLTGEEKDYQSMITHHISTVLLLTLSFFHYHRIGVIIAFSHDLGDLFFLPAKLFHKFYETRKIEILNNLSYIFFTVFILVFFSTRIFLNSKIIYHITKQLFYPNNIITFYNREVYPEVYILDFLLFVNLAIQVFWQIMIIKFAYNLTLGEKPKDEKGNEYFKKK